MQYRVFGRTGWRVSAIGLGCWQLGGQLGEVSEADGIATVHAAIQAGINLFDTADSYGPRRSEEVLGKALSGGRRPHVFVATKVGNLARPDGHPLSFTTPEHIYACCDASLHRLQTDYIDLYQCHIREHPRHDVFLEAFERLLEAGKIRAYGTSSFFPSEIDFFDSHGRCHVAQIPYSVLERDYEADAFALCEARNIGVLVRGPLAQGVLSGKFAPDHQFDDPTRSGWNVGALTSGSWSGWPPPKACVRCQARAGAWPKSRWPSLSRTLRPPAPSRARARPSRCKPTPPRPT